MPPSSPGRRSPTPKAAPSATLDRKPSLQSSASTAFPVVAAAMPELIPGGRAGRAPLSTGVVAKVLALTCSEPPGETTHWTGRAMAKAVGISLRAVQRLWEANRLQPHRSED